MNYLWCFILSIALTTGLFVVVPVQAAILYVDKDQTCPGTGSSASPYCSIQNAFNVVNPGDSIRIRNSASPYDETAVLTRTGTVGSPIIIEPDVGHNPILRNSTGANAAMMELQKVSYITVQNLTFDGAGVNTSWHAINVRATLSSTNGASMFGIQILGNTFKNWGGSAAQASTPAIRWTLAINGGYCSPPPCPGKVIGAIVRNNTFDANRQRSMQILHADNTLVENNIFMNIKCGKDSDNATNTVGIHILDSASFQTYGTIIRNNVFRDFEPRASCGVPHTTNTFDTMAGVWCDVGPMSGVVEGNHVYNLNPGDPFDNGQSYFASTGIHIEAGCWGGWMVKNNVVHDIGYQAMSQRLTGDLNPANWPADPTYFLNNTVYRVRGRVFGIGAGKATIKNNIVYGVGSYALMSPSIAVSGAYNIDYNLYYDSVWSNHVGTWGTWGSPTNPPADLATWRTQCNCDANSTFANPLFVNTTPGQEDFHLQATSPARGAGEGGVDLGANPSQSTSDILPPLNLRVIQ